MLTVTYLLPVSILGLVWYSYRANRKRVRGGEAGFRPEGKIRWGAEDVR